MLREFLKKRWYFYIFGIISLIVIDLLQLFVPRVISKAINTIQVLDNVNTLNEVKTLVLSILGLAFGMLFGRFWWR